MKRKASVANTTITIVIVCLSIRIFVFIFIFIKIFTIGYIKTISKYDTDLFFTSHE